MVFFLLFLFFFICANFPQFGGTLDLELFLSYLFLTLSLNWSQELIQIFYLKLDA